MSKSLQQFREWSVAKKKVANPNGTYPGQCVSLVQQYLTQVFNIPFAPRGNAKDFVPPTFKRVTGAVKKGDIIRYGSNYGGGYGHIGLIDDDGYYLDQNGIRVLAVGRQRYPFSGINAIYRPTKKFNIKTPKPKYSTYKVNVVAARFRSAPTTASKTTSVRQKGYKFKVIKFVNGQSINGSVKWAKTEKNGRYMHSSLIKKV